MGIKAALRRMAREARHRRRAWIRLLDSLRALLHSAGRALLFVQLTRGDELHQRSVLTMDERYPALFDAICGRLPANARILSFGCSTGEELVALRRRLPEADLVGADINPRARRLARRRLAGDGRATILDPAEISGQFDAVLALAVLQRDPHFVEESGLADLSLHYPFARFERTASALAGRVRRGGLFAIHHAHYRFEDVAAAADFVALDEVKGQVPPLFAPDGRRYPPTVAASSLFLRQPRH